MTVEITDNQRKIIDYLQEYKVDPKNNGFSPSYSELAEDLGYKRSTIYNIVQDIVAALYRLKVQGRIEIIEIDTDEKGRIIVNDIEVRLKRLRAG